MANTLQTPSNIWRIDTAANTLIQAGQIDVKFIRWTAIANAGDSLIIEDAASKIIHQAQASTSKADEEHVYPRGRNWWMNGFKVTTLGSGIVYIGFH